MKCLLNMNEMVYTKCPYKHFLLSLLKKKKECSLMFLGNFPSHLHIDYKSDQTIITNTSNVIET